MYSTTSGRFLVTLSKRRTDTSSATKSRSYRCHPNRCNGRSGDGRSHPSLPVCRNGAGVHAAVDLIERIGLVIDLAHKLTDCCFDLVIGISRFFRFAFSSSSLTGVLSMSSRSCQDRCSPDRQRANAGLFSVISFQHLPLPSYASSNTKADTTRQQVIHCAFSDLNHLIPFNFQCFDFFVHCS